MSETQLGTVNMAQLDPSLAQFAEGMEIDIMTDMFQRMSSACMKKCISPKYRDSELSKGESVCIDRCVAKFVDVHSKIGKMVADNTMLEQENLKNQAAATSAQPTSQ